MALHDLKNVKTIHIRHESEEDGALYEGDFTIKRLSITDTRKQLIRTLELNGGYHYDPSHPGCGVSREVNHFNDMLAHLEIAILKFPSWWNLEEISDLDVVYAVHREVIAFENSFRNRKRKGTEEAGESSGGSQERSEAPSQESDRREDVRAMVDQEVFAAPEP